jgi:hypothetical protein
VPLRRAAARHRVELPVDRVAEAERLVAEQIETAQAHRFGAAITRSRASGSSSAEQRGRALVGAPAKKRDGASSWNSSRRGASAGLELGPGETRSLKPLRGFLPAAIGHFADRHPQQAAQHRCSFPNTPGSTRP